MHPRYGLMVYGNGIADSPGTWLSALLARTSWNVTPGNSGTWTLRSSPRMLGMPGRAEGSSRSSRCASHRMTPCEHTFERMSSGAGQPPPERRHTRSGPRTSNPRVEERGEAVRSQLQIGEAVLDRARGRPQARRGHAPTTLPAPA